MTIHNLKFQGVYDVKTIKEITGLSDYYFTPDKLEAYKDCNFPRRTDSAGSCHGGKQEQGLSASHGSG